MEVDELASLFTSCTQSAFRLQALASYSVEDEQEEFNRFLAGKPFPNVDNDPWLMAIKEKVEAGVKVTNLHVLPDRLTPYLRFAIDWSYVFRHLVGERILFVSETDARRCDPELTQDFWLFDDCDVVVMGYDSKGRFVNAERVTDKQEVGRYLAIRDTAIRQAFDLPELLARRRSGLIF